MKSDTTGQIYKQLVHKYNKSTISKKEYAKEMGVSVSTVDNQIKLVAPEKPTNLP